MVMAIKRTTDGQKVSGPLSAVLRHARTHAGLSQSELGERLAASQVSVSQWESGQHRPTDAVIRRWASECGGRVCWDSLTGLWTWSAARHCKIAVK